MPQRHHLPCKGNMAVKSQPVFLTSQWQCAVAILSAHLVDYLHLHLHLETIASESDECNHSS